MFSRPVTWPPRLERIRSLARTTAVVSGGVLAAFHGWLFAVQAAEGRLDDPWLVFRWTAAAALVVALAAIHRGGASVWSRQGIAVWVLAALLHGPAVATDFSASLDSLALPETVAASLLQTFGSVTALAITLWMLAGLLARRDRQARLYAGLAAVPSGAGMFGDGFSPQYFSRPPPQRR
ncbi:MAG: hypothetical protein AB7P34_20580 [Vicinamibacterales bacterium]